MATYEQRYSDTSDAARTEREGTGHRVHTETGPFSRTSEFWVFLVTALAILIAGSAVGANGDKADVFAADRVWLYVTLLASAYLLSRGIAKAGSHGHDEAGGQHGHGRGHGTPPIAARVKAAARVLTDGPEDEGRRHRHEDAATAVDVPPAPAQRGDRL